MDLRCVLPRRDEGRRESGCEEMVTDGYCTGCWVRVFGPRSMSAMQCRLSNDQCRHVHFFYLKRALA